MISPAILADLLLGIDGFRDRLIAADAFEEAGFPRQAMALRLCKHILYSRGPAVYRFQSREHWLQDLPLSFVREYQIWIACRPLDKIVFGPGNQEIETFMKATLSRNGLVVPLPDSIWEVFSQLIPPELSPEDLLPEFVP